MSVKSEGIDKNKLIRLTLLRFGSGIAGIWLILFSAAGTIKYWNAWIFLVAAAVPMTLEFIYLMKNDPELLEKRMKTKETEKSLKKLVKLSLVFMVIAFIIPGIDYRFQWSYVPLWLIIVGIILFETGYFLFSLVMKQNSYASRVIEIQENQKLIDYGLYAIIRHPMYLSSIMIDISIPFILGSFYALIPMIFCCIEIIPRILNEEDVLKKDLQGYEEYMKRVRYRIIPFIW